MKAAILQHEKSVTAGSTIDWLQSRQIDFQIFPLFENTTLPHSAEFDFLVICGGTMNVDQENIHPWLIHEKKMIKDWIHEKKPIVGLCLGSQLIAEVLGAAVGKHHLMEIGWLPVQITDEKPLTVFQWHEYASALPPHCKLLATNKNCQNQAFTMDHFLLAFQFHPETTVDWALKCAADPDLPESTDTIQSSEQITKGIVNQPHLQDWYFAQLDLLIKNYVIEIK